MELKHITGNRTGWVGPAFNRTLWNWNTTLSGYGIQASDLLIVPYGIETENKLWGCSDVLAF